MITTNYLNDRPMLLLSETNINWYWIYTVESIENGLEFIGYGKIRDIVDLRPILKSEYYRQDRTYVYTLIEAVRDNVQAINKMNKWLKLLSPNDLPRMNKKWIYNYVGRKVRCNETGDVFETCVDACRRYGLSASALSNHLNRRKGFRTVKGKTFSYV